MGYTKIFEHAVSSDNPKVLEEISREDINLAVWENPLSPHSRQYLDGLDLNRDIVPKNSQYYEHTKIQVFNRETGTQTMAELVDYLPDREHKEALIDDLVRLKDSFLKATGFDQVNVAPMLFKPRAADRSNPLSTPGFWHTDGGNNIGIITLKGDKGTLIRPNSSVTNYQSEIRKIEAVIPEEQPFIREIGVGQFAIFKCLNHDSPLIHATPPYPMTRERRLVLQLHHNF